MANPIGKPWTCAGVTDVTECETSADAIKKAGLDFEVRKAPIVAKLPALSEDIDRELEAGQPIDTNNGLSFCYGGREYRDITDMFATYRTDNNKPLGIVGQKYEIVQNWNAFSFFDTAIGTNQAVWDTAGCFDDGRRTFISARLPETIRVNGKDEINNFLVFMNSYDGSTGVSIMITPIRMVCQNRILIATKKASQFIRFRHTMNVQRNIDIAGDILGIARQEIASATEMYEHLTAIKMSDIEVWKYICEVNMTETEYTSVAQADDWKNLFQERQSTKERHKISTRKLNVMLSTFDYYNTGFGQYDYRGTAYGAFNAITGYYSNVANISGEKRFDSLLLGTANNVMHKALELVMA